MSTAAGDLGSDMREALARASKRVGPAVMQARLYDIGTYPGLVPSERAEDVVHGEVLALCDANAVWPWLDRYEGIGAAPGGSDDEYARRRCPVILASGEIVEAWVYIFQGDISGARPVPDGRWRVPSA